MSQSFSVKSIWFPVILVGLGAITMASAQTSNSPFANKSKVKAWEKVNAWESAPAPAAQTPTYQAPSYQAPTVQTPSYQAGPAFETPSYPAPSYQTPTYPAPSPGGAAYNYQPQSAPAPVPSYSSPELAGGTYSAPQTPAATTYQPSYNSTGAAYGQPQQAPYGQQNYGQPQQAPYGQPSYSQNAPVNYDPNYNGAQQAGPAQYPAPKRSWRDKLGLSRIVTSFTGGGRVGAAGTTRSGRIDDDLSADFIADGYAEFEASTITRGGLEYGLNLEARAQYDADRRGFGGRVGDCPASNLDCASTLVGGAPTAIRGHTSQFYTDGPSNAKDAEFALEGAYLFLRSSYGDVTIGRDDGAAYLFSLGAPSLLAVGASNSPVDYTGLDSVKTVNDASGFAEKITYTSPRLLGDQIGIGVQFGASYAPNARACGVDYCVRSNGNDGTGVLSPDLDDVAEVGLALDRKFAGGLGVELTGTYARASEQSGLAAFDDLSAYNAGIEVTLADWTVGGSWLQSNNGLEDGDYTAWDIGLTWKPSALGFTLGYGEADDDNIDLSSKQATAGVTYDFNRFTLGTGVQYVDRDVPVVSGGVRNLERERAAAFFIEGGFKF